MKQGLLAKILLFTIMFFFITITAIYYGWFFDDFSHSSPTQGIALLVALVFTILFFAFYTLDFLKDKD
ncbi:hypothetical protein [Thalassotalea aquiviva]|uniref:hypothetical protein n=1 Tax=Thalassotalea aquiviva TaxID=3242415 RepID=UPI00352B8F3D